MSAIDQPGSAALESSEPESDSERSPSEERSPATVALGVSWVVIYLAMALCQGTLHAKGQAALSGGVEPSIAHEFGTMSPGEVRGGEPWRALTASFLHFSLFHLGFNLLMFYQLGREIESWYGPWLFVAVVVVIGLGSNLLAAWLKPLLGQPMLAPSAGGSGIVCGLIALLAVVGWRSRTRIGDALKAQMVGLLVFVAVLGWLIPGVDNVVHGAGALVGAAIGLVHRRLWPLRGRRPARFLGLAAVGLLSVCTLAQARVGFIESRAEALLKSSERRKLAVQALMQLDAIHLQLELMGRVRVPFASLDPYHYLSLERELAHQLAQLEEYAPELTRGDSAADFREFADLVNRAAHPLPSAEQRGRFVETGRALLGRLHRSQVAAEGEFQRWLAWLKVPERAPIRVQLGPTDLRPGGQASPRSVIRRAR